MKDLYPILAALPPSKCLVCGEVVRLPERWAGGASELDEVTSVIQRQADGTLRQSVAHKACAQ
jgi:hypothetical protein